MTTGLERTWLFVPGHRPDRFDKAVAAGADAVILDLEDAVGPAEKETARASIAQWLDGSGSAWVRVNAAGTAWLDDDVATLATAPGLLGFMLPKAERAEDFLALRAAVAERRPGHGIGSIALVESAVGVRHAYDLADCPAVDRLAFGSIDFAADLGADEDDASLLLARSTLVLASRSASKPGPIDGVTVDVADPAAVRRATDQARRLGFTGKLCIHPSQIAPATQAFRPAEADVDWARRVLAHDQDGSAFSFEGQMVDKPVLDRARQILARAGESSSTDPQGNA